MTKRNLFKTALFIVLISAMLLSAVGVAYAATATKSTCKTFYYSGARVAKVCLKGNFEYIGISTKGKAKWSVKSIYQSGWSIFTYNQWFHPTGWTTGIVWLEGDYGFLKNGSYKGKANCDILCTNVYGNLVCSKGCK